MLFHLIMLSSFCHLLLCVFCNWVVLLSSNLLCSILLPYSQTLNCKVKCMNTHTEFQ